MTCDPFDRCPRCQVPVIEQDNPHFPYCDDLCEGQHAEASLIWRLRWVWLVAQLKRICGRI